VIRAELVKQLRAKTGAGIMECKRALAEVDGDIEKAVDVLRKSGVAKASKKAERTTKEGRIEIVNSGEGNQAAILEVDCETDFVARTDDFQDFVRQLADHVLATAPQDIPTLLASSLSGRSGQSVEEALQSLIGKIGENMSVMRFQSFTVGEGETLGAYIHAGNQIGVIVKIAGSVEELAVKDVAMHVAAMHPHYISPQDVPPEVVEREKNILRSADDMKQKPTEVAEKMVEGRFRKFLSQVCLTEQVFIRDPQGKQTVAVYLKSLDPQARIAQFVRFQVGESSTS
jgi:elongation factor Ts